MHDLKDIRDDPDAFDAGLARRGLAPRAGEILVLDQEVRKFTGALNDLQSRRNVASKRIGAAKGKGDEAEAKRLTDEVETIKAQMPAAEAEQKRYADQVNEILAGLPNIPAPDVPRGTSEDDNVEIRREGEPKRLNSPKEHFDLGEALGQMDFETAAAMSGARFVLLKGQIARLERAIANFMLDLHTDEFGYTECAPPLLVRDEAVFGAGPLFGTGQLPKFEDDLFATALPYERALGKFVQAEASLRAFGRNFDALLRLENSAEQEAKKVINEKFANQVHKLIAEVKNRPELLRETKRMWLIPTAEVPLANIVREKILDEEDLPLRLTAWTPCFRSEAGSAGKDTRGMIRLHQFSKVELVSITAPEQSTKEHERMTTCAEEVLKRLELPFRTMVLSTGDMGFQAKKTYDIEVWLPGQNRYREISSCSNCGAFQARRMRARFKAKGEKQTQFVHTLNGSGLAVGRTLVAILENYQEPDGSITVPDVLKSYMGGIERIERA